ncbi:MAG: hypothetical protein QOF89_1029 [Acidobacteriota bacterium]|jgi:hypothetical protein|nr:hypothetical protein [Acidobacteriota bacterium]
MTKARLGVSALLCLGALIVNAEIAGAQSCRIPQRFPGATAASMVFKADVNDNLGDWGTIFMDADTSGCEVTARDFLKSKLQQQNLDANGWKGGLRGGDVFLVTAAALRLGGRGLLTSSIHNEVLKALASYDFANWGGPCARGSANGCMDDYAVAAAGHAWAGAYLWFTQSATVLPTRDAAWFIGEARKYIKLSLSPQDTLCVRAILPTASACSACLNDYNTAYQNDGDPTSLRNDLFNNTKEVLSFEHGFENPNYGIGLLTSVSVAVQGLQVATGTPYVPSNFQKVMAHAVFRTGQRHAPQTTNGCATAWIDNCVGLSCSMIGNCISGSCLPPADGCGENFGGVKYDAGMYPVKSLLQNEFALPAGNPVMLGSPYYQFDQFSGLCSPSKFSPTGAFFHDGRYAAYYQISSQWAYGTQPWVWGVSPAQSVDSPQSSTPVRGATTFSGWAFDGESGATLTTASFAFTVDGQPITLSGFSYGGWRTDVCSTTGVNKGTNCPVGWSGTFNPPVGFATGTHTLKVKVTSANGQSISNFQRSFTYQP